MLVYGYINGENGPRIKTEPGFVTCDLKIKVELDFGGASSTIATR
jgi:hypothetical protein